jgi:hypothetical protein
VQIGERVDWQQQSGWRGAADLLLENPDWKHVHSATSIKVLVDRRAAAMEAARVSGVGAQDSCRQVPG